MRRMCAGRTAVLAVGIVCGVAATVRADEENADRDVQVGQYWLYKGDTEKALEWFNDAIDEESEYVPAYGRAAMLG